MTRLILIAAAMLVAAAAHCRTSHPAEILPRPADITVRSGAIAVAGLTYNADGCGAAADSLLRLHAAHAPARKATLNVRIIPMPEGAHTIDITPQRITVRAAGQAEALHAVQSLRQLLDADSIACGFITDVPVYPYRGLHVDVSRHWRGIPFLKRQLEAMSRLKLNKMHLHLTDGAGWRMAVEGYPELTGTASHRPQERWTDWCAAGATYGGAYGGCYTAAELRDLVAYAARLHIDIVPEIEMPGHCDEVVAVMPHLSCNGTGPDLCPGKEATYAFLRDILDQTLDIFPGHYIHIGGDEASKAAWRTCPDCNGRAQELGLESTDKLQDYLIGRVTAYLRSKGRTPVGWDEITDGGAAPDATVMCWRGTDAVTRALEAGHDVIYTPGTVCYLDHCQDAPFTQPLSIGGYLPFDRIAAAILPDGLTGIQANLWAEYITDDTHAEYMYYPRAFAIAELAWSGAAHTADIRSRAIALADAFRADGYNTFDLRDEYGERPESLLPVRHLALGAPVSYTIPYTPVYPAAGPTALTDGIRGGWTYQDRRWQGWFSDMDVTLDLGEAKPLHTVQVSFMHCPGPGVHLPDSVEVMLSVDGQTFETAALLRPDLDPDYPKTLIRDYCTPLDHTARYVRIRAVRNPRGCLFADEIIVN